MTDDLSPADTSAEERYHREAIHAARLQYEAAIKPHMDRLVYLHGLKPPRPIFITLEQAQAAGIAIYPAGERG